MKFLKTQLVISALFIMSQSGLAQTGAGRPGAFLRIGAGARALALGGAFSAIANDPSASFWNAAGLSQISQIQFAATHYRMSLDRTHNFVGTALPVGYRSTLGLSWIGLGVGGIEARTGNTANPDFLFSTSQNALLLSYGRELNTYLSLGASVKAIYQKMQSTEAFGFGFDVSLLAKPMDNVRVGFAVQDIGTSLKWSNNFQETVPRSIRAGIAMDLTDNLLVAVDALKIAGEKVGFAYGVEYNALKLFPLRLGYGQGGIVGGAGINVPLQSMNLNFDYAFGRDQLDGRDSHKLSVGVTFFAKKSRGIDLADNAAARSRSRVKSIPLPDKRAHIQGKTVYLEVLARGLNVRSGPGVKNKRVAIIRKGQQFKKITASGYWYKIELASGKFGWVHHKYVKEVLRN